MVWRPAYIGVGSNLDHPQRQVRRALSALAQLPGTRLVCRSPLYGSEPLGGLKQPTYVNAVAGLLTQQEPGAFFDAVRLLERELGRVRGQEHWAPRIIDLDLLVFARLHQESAELRLPHPGIVRRNFVLYPLRDVAPGLYVPGCGRVAWLAERVDPSGIWRLGDEAATHGA
ncbi:MAG TPA: 2-amino-4-hydroxy-6-hydroxymethyldihydropteridine diphosphokinase [Steroidobacteraceae bacterium]|jgi:2-amino-4-hydroxy-6-hydroxymethyldihydropteridine diphosphokinase|nr:2-amino-4-hydroxy-6-hydroxymethyldihydropteridine diphosphokinase [Steroidobacteraceae bacterium]